MNFIYFFMFEWKLRALMTLNDRLIQYTFYLKSLCEYYIKYNALKTHLTMSANSFRSFAKWRKTNACSWTKSLPIWKYELTLTYGLMRLQYSYVTDIVSSMNTEHRKELVRSPEVQRRYLQQREKCLIRKRAF